MLPGAHASAASIEEFAEFEEIGESFESIEGCGCGDVVEFCEVEHEFAWGEPLVESGAGGDESDIAADVEWILGDIESGHADGPGCGFEESHHHAECGRFAGAVGAEQSVDFSGLHLEGDAINGVNGSCGCVEGADELLHIDCGHDVRCLLAGVEVDGDFNAGVGESGDASGGVGSEIDADFDNAGICIADGIICEDHFAGNDLSDFDDGAFEFIAGAIDDDIGFESCGEEADIGFEDFGDGLHLSDIAEFHHAILGESFAWSDVNAEDSSCNGSSEG